MNAVWKSSSVIVYFPSMRETLGSNLNNSRKERREDKRFGVVKETKNKYCPKS